jgi:putative Ca2+/H+ antiporter (TMEM165/GDT1 family)
LSTVALAAILLVTPSGAAQAAVTTINSSSLLSQSSRWWESLTETGFYQAFSLVFLSEIGDKTFFIAGLLAMKTSRLISFIGSIGALAAMTFVSVLIGQIFHAVPAGIADGIPLDDICAVAAFAFFGFKTLKEAFEMEEGSSTMDEEFAEAEEEVEDFGSRKAGFFTSTPWGQIASIFALVFAAEFGDRSFLSTIALSAAQNPVSVAGGAIAAHAAATGIAVGGGAYLAKYISERVIGFIGGTLFLVFAVTTALGIF